MLEASLYEGSSFITLTYRPEALPATQKLWSRDLQLFMKKVRNCYGKVRFFAAGELGAQNARPHFHIILFGLRTDSGAISELWDRGFTSVSDLCVDRAAYACSYVVKKSYGQAVPDVVGGLREFARMSLRPGIGSGAVEELAKHQATAYGVNYLREHKDVFQFVRFEGRVFPIGRYLVRALRARVGVPDVDPARVVIQMERRELEDPESVEFLRGKHYRYVISRRKLAEMKERI